MIRSSEEQEARAEHIKITEYDLDHSKDSQDPLATDINQAWRKADERTEKTEEVP